MGIFRRITAVFLSFCMLFSCTTYTSKAAASSGAEDPSNSPVVTVAGAARGEEHSEDSPVNNPSIATDRTGSADPGAQWLILLRKIGLLMKLDELSPQGEEAGEEETLPAEETAPEETAPAEETGEEETAPAEEITETEETTEPEETQEPEETTEPGETTVPEEPQEPQERRSRPSFYGRPQGCTSRRRPGRRKIHPA